MQEVKRSGNNPWRVPLGQRTFLHHCRIPENASICPVDSETLPPSIHKNLALFPDSPPWKASRTGLSSLHPFSNNLSL